MPVQPQGTPIWVGLALDPEDLSAGFVEHPLVNELVDGLRHLESRVQLDQSLRPEEALLELILDELADSLVANGQEAPDEVAVLLDQAVSQTKNVHGFPHPDHVSKQTMAGAEGSTPVRGRIWFLLELRIRELWHQNPKLKSGCRVIL
ncbi:hypothetical protein A7Q09_05330 [Methylacidiphilum sp. Yel]|nr:hypothetical protein A7Q09_05330 [Methylacidiphilum sp. Yel]